MKIFQIITDYTIQEKPHRFISPLNSSEKPSTMGKLASSQQSVNLPQFHSVILWHSFGFPGISISSEPVWVTSKKSISPSSRHDPSVKWHQVPLQMVWGKSDHESWQGGGPFLWLPPVLTLRVAGLAWIWDVTERLGLSWWFSPGFSPPEPARSHLHRSRPNPAGSPATSLPRAPQSPTCTLGLCESDCSDCCLDSTVCHGDQAHLIFGDEWLPPGPGHPWILSSPFLERCWGIDPRNVFLNAMVKLMSFGPSQRRWTDRFDMM